MKNDRKNKMHGVISDPEMQQRIRAQMKFENISFDELLERHLVFPGEADSYIHKDYIKIENMTAEAYNKPGIKRLMEVLWILIINCAKDNFDIEGIIHNIEADIRLGTFKKRK